MRIRLSTWQPKHLLAAWSVYWAGLLVWGVGSVLPTLWRLSRPESHGNASLSFDNGAFHFTVAEAAKTVWQGTIGAQTVALLIAVPPLVLWALWLRANRRRGPRSPRGLHEGGPANSGSRSHDEVGISRNDRL